ncbi:MAG TPA: DUF3048 domain-containing protein [Candidatus Saccharimonadales bacterium]|nr:DUF3048 domain-containing protein [Candidatus Saccharimonadales bacterium]
MQKKIIFLVLVVGVFAVSFGGAYLFFSKAVAPSKTSYFPAQKTANGEAFDPNLPKTEPCPLNGALYSTQQRDWWQKHRPLGVMIENHEDARPQSGLSSADIVYEAVAEGAITRFLTVFYCNDAPYVGPVRSARTYFVDFLSEYGPAPLYAHVGGANSEGPANALGQIEEYGWANYNDLSEFSIGCPVFCRIENRNGVTVATEHTMYSSTSKLWDYAAKSRQLTNVDKSGKNWDMGFVPYTFKDDAPLADRPASQTIRLEFWPQYSQYAVDWTYDRVNNVYLRSNGGKAHLDRNTNKQIAAKNIVVLWMQESNANDGYENNLHLLYGDKGTGKAVIFMDGKQTTGTWKKQDRKSHLYIYDANGAQVKFDRGLIWFEVLPLQEGSLTVK